MPLWYEDFAVGDRVQLDSYTIDKAEMIDFATQWDPRDFHVDEASPATTIFGSVTASGIYTQAIYTKLLNEKTSDWVARGALGYENLRFPRAVLPGDVLTGESEVLEKRLSKSRPGYGIMKVRDSLTNQHGELVLELFAAVLMVRAPGWDAQTDPT
jgi:acyl dehydratase